MDIELGHGLMERSHTPSSYEPDGGAAAADAAAAAAGAARLGAPAAGPSDGSDPGAADGTAPLSSGGDSSSGAPERQPQAHAPLPPALVPAPPGLVLTPTRLRLDSRALAAHAVTQWGSYAVFAVTLLLKLGGARPSASWWAVFAPLWLAHAAHLPLQLVLLAATAQLVQLQLGPPPLPRAPPSLRLQYDALRRARERQHMLEHAAALIDGLAAAVCAFLVCWQLSGGPAREAELPWSAVLAPLWAAWAVGVVLTLLQPRTERQWAHTRDLRCVFSAFVALKLSPGGGGMSWALAFLVPWLCFGALALALCVLVTMFVHARRWVTRSELAVPLAFAALVAAALAQLPGWVALARLLDGAGAGAGLADALLPMAASWAAMAVAGLALAYALSRKEAVRRRLAAAGAVWTRHSAAAGGLAAGRDAAQAAVDAMSDAEVDALAERLMRDCAPPPRELVRVSATLYRRAAPGGAGAGDAARGEGPRDQAAAAETPPVRLAPKKAVGSGSQDELHVGLSPRGRTGADVVDDDDAVAFVEVRLLPAPGRGPPAAPPGSGAEAEAAAVAAAPDGGGAPKSGDGRASCVIDMPPLRRSDSVDSMEDTCSICFNAPGTCVLLDCGHAGYCRGCARRLFVRPPQQCPLCRAPIEQVVELEPRGGEGGGGETVRVRR